MKVTAKYADEPITVDVPQLDPQLPDLIERYGAEAIRAKFISACVVEIQALIRRQVAKGDPVDVSGWAPSAQRERKTAIQKIESKFADLSEEQKAELLAALQKQTG